MRDKNVPIKISLGRRWRETIIPDLRSLRCRWRETKVPSIKISGAGQKSPIEISPRLLARNKLRLFAFSTVAATFCLSPIALHAHRCRLRNGYWNRPLALAEGNWLPFAKTRSNSTGAIDELSSKTTTTYLFRLLALAANAYSISRRIASERDGLSFCRLAHLSMASRVLGGRRTVRTGSRPVAGRPGLFGVTFSVDRSAMFW